MKRVRLAPVRLTEIPLSQRMHAAQQACRHAADENERADLFIAALFPSDKCYWVHIDTDHAELAA